MGLQFNQVTIGGHIAREPEIRQFAGERVLCTFALATNRHWTTEKGEKKDEATFIECQAWQRTAEFIAQYFALGDAAFMVGHLKQENWTDKEDKKRSRLIMVIDRALFSGDKAKIDAPASPGGAA